MRRLFALLNEEEQLIELPQAMAIVVLFQANWTCRMNFFLIFDCEVFGLSGLIFKRKRMFNLYSAK
jgi:hypothetical protein